MSIRRLQYQIDYVHILTFREEYKRAVYPYFGFDNLEYAIDNESSISEGIRLIFKNDQIAFFLRKEGITLLFEGDVSELKNQNGVIKIFWELYDKIKSFHGYTKTTRHALTVHAVEIMEKHEVEGLLKRNTYLAVNPFGDLNEFSCIYEFKKEDIEYKFSFGNYSERDLKIHDLTPFKTKYNEDLVSKLGVMGRLEVIEFEKNPTFSKFKSLLSKAEGVFALAQFNLVKNEK